MNALYYLMEDLYPLFRIFDRMKLGDKFQTPKFNIFFNKTRRQ